MARWYQNEKVGGGGTVGVVVGKKMTGMVPQSKKKINLFRTRLGRAQ